jgi:hypothetical protein
MESFQQKVPPISLGAFEDIRLKSRRNNRFSVPSIFFSWRKLCTTSQTYNKRHKIQHTGAQTWVKKLRERNWTLSGMTSYFDVIWKKWRRAVSLVFLDKHTRGNIDPISIINTFNPSPQRDFLGFWRGTVHSAVSRIDLKRLVLLLMQLSFF